MADNERSEKSVLILGAAVLLLAAPVVWYFGFRTVEAHVAGTVTLGGEPVAGAQVIFLGAGEQDPAPLVSSTDDEGHYQLASNTGRGIPLGSYKVVVSKMALRSGAVLQGERMLQARNDGQLVNVLPRVYEDRGTTTLQCDVRPGVNTINLELQRRP